MSSTLHTPRLTLRRRVKEDFPAYAAMWADPVTVTHFSTGPFSREDSWQRFARLEGLWQLVGFASWLVEETATGDFVGDVGPFDFKRDLAEPLDGMLEFGWAIAARHYGKGYAREAVRAALAWSDQNCPHPTHCALIAPTNAPSMAVADAVGFAFAREVDFKGQPSRLYLRERGAPIPS